MASCRHNIPLYLRFQDGTVLAERQHAAQKRAGGMEICVGRHVLAPNVWAQEAEIYDATVRLEVSAPVAALTAALARIDAALPQRRDIFGVEDSPANGTSASVWPPTPYRRSPNWEPAYPSGGMGNCYRVCAMRLGYLITTPLGLCH